ncbi:MAG: hypothetical protein ABEK36_03940, partial [Candidatus Aenigmatarchaeota archaeon]
WGYLAVYGVMDSVKIDASTVVAAPGKPFTTSGTSKKGIPDASMTAGTCLGRLLEGGDTDGLYRVFLTVGE